MVDLEFFMPRCSIETHTSMASLGGFGLSLEDVAMLTSLPLFDEAFVACLYSDREDKKRISALKTSLSK